MNGNHGNRYKQKSEFWLVWMVLAITSWKIMIETSSLKHITAYHVKYVGKNQYLVKGNHKNRYK